MVRIYGLLLCGGGGTSSNPYIIKTADQLARVLNYNNTKQSVYCQIDPSISEIDLSAHYWDGVYQTPGGVFNFNGNGCVIKNMTCNGSYAPYSSLGFVSYTGNGSETSVYNVEFVDSIITVTSESPSGAVICGDPWGFTYVHDVVITNPRVLCYSGKNVGIIYGIHTYSTTQNVYVHNTDKFTSYNIDITSCGQSKTVYAGLISSDSSMNGNSTVEYAGITFSGMQVFCESYVPVFIGGAFGTGYCRAAMFQDCVFDLRVVLSDLGNGLTKPSTWTIGGLYGNVTTSTNYYFPKYPARKGDLVIDLEIIGDTDECVCGVIAPDQDALDCFYNSSTGVLPSQCLLPSSSYSAATPFDHNRSDTIVLVPGVDKIYRLASWKHTWCTQKPKFTIDVHGNIMYVFDLAKRYTTIPSGCISASWWPGYEGGQDFRVGISLVYMEPTGVANNIVVVPRDQFTLPPPTYPADVSSITYIIYANGDTSSEYARIKSSSMITIPDTSITTLILDTVEITRSTSTKYKKSSSTTVDVSEEWYKTASGTLKKGEGRSYKNASGNLV